MYRKQTVKFVLILKLVVKLEMPLGKRQNLKFTSTINYREEKVP